MDNILYSSDTQKAKCQRIVENTVRECNRVLESWKLNKSKTTSYEDVISLIGSYLTRFIRKEFNITSGFKISNYSPLCVIENYKVLKLSISETTYYRYLPQMIELKKVMDNFDYEGLNKTIELENFIQTKNSKPVNSLVDINFDNIKNIKF